MKLVVGLGNPGSKYRNTRHNVGFMVAALLAQQAGGDKPRNRFDAETLELELGGERVLLICPLTYMNLSGKSVLAARDFYKIDNDSILVVCDDFHLPLGRIRLRPGGSAGGQKGLQDILQRLGTQQIPRLRLGIGPVPASWNPADFVLGKFTKDQQEEVELVVAQAADAVRLWCREGIEAAMNRYNASPEPTTKKTSQPKKQQRPAGDAAPQDEATNKPPAEAPANQPGQPNPQAAEPTPSPDPPSPQNPSPPEHQPPGDAAT